MLDFDKYVARYGEFTVQDLIERLERYEGGRPGVALTLEDRWMALMNSTPAVAHDAQALAA